MLAISFLSQSLRGGPRADFLLYPIIAVVVACEFIGDLYSRVVGPSPATSQSKKQQ